MQQHKRLSIVLLVICASFTIISCAQNSSVKDKDGNAYPIRKLADGNFWMTQNLNTVTEGSYCYENKEANCAQYGRLYTWKIAQENCSALGDGWTLPSKESWELLAKAFGGKYDGVDDKSGKAAYVALLKGGSSGLEAVLGGGRAIDVDEYKRIDAHGFYWTSTESDSSNVWFINFGKGSGKLFIQPDGEKPRAFAVRCMKSATK